MTLETDAGAADSVANEAGEPLVLHVQVLLMASLFRETHEFASTLLACFGILVAFRLLATAVCCVGLQHLKCDFELLEYCFDLVFMNAYFGLQLFSRQLRVQRRELVSCACCHPSLSRVHFIQDVSFRAGFPGLKNLYFCKLIPASTSLSMSHPK